MKRHLCAVSMIQANQAYIYIVGATLGFFIVWPVQAADVRSDNVNTGSSSTNINAVSLTTQFIDQSTSIVVSSNTFNFDLQTGRNQANANTGNGLAKSGSIKVELVDKNPPTVSSSTTINNQADNSSAVSGGLGLASTGSGSTIVTDDPISFATANNANTGANTTNANSINQNATTLVTQTSFRAEDNHSSLALNTDQNSASFNTGSGEVVSGNISVVAKKETLPPPLPEKPKPPPVAPTPTQPSQPAAPAPQPTAIPAPILELKPVMAEKLAQLAPSQPTQLITPVAPAAQPIGQPTVPAPAAKLPQAGAETPLLATLFSAGTLKAAHYLKRRKRELARRNKKPW